MSYQSGSQGSRKTGNGLSPRPNLKSCANPVIEQWLMEWKEEAEKRDSNMKFVYGKALSSLRKHPLPLGSGQECKSLKFFGKTLARKIDAKIAKEKVCLTTVPLNDSSSPPASQSQAKPMQVVAGQCVKEVKALKAKPKIKRPYFPLYRSGGYAILMAMAKLEKMTGYRGYVLKTEILDCAQNYSDSFLNKGRSASIWQAMTTLIDRDLVKQQGHPIKYTLTEVGRKQAAMLMQF